MDVRCPRDLADVARAKIVREDRRIFLDALGCHNSQTTGQAADLDHDDTALNPLLGAAKVLPAMASGRDRHRTPVVTQHQQILNQAVRSAKLPCR